MFAAAWLLLGVGGITAGATCPSRAQVEAHLMALVGPAAMPEELEVVRNDEGLSLRLSLATEPGGRVTVERQVAFDKAQSCDDLAEAAAVIVATWLPPPPAEPVRELPRLVMQSRAPPFREEPFARRPDWTVGLAAGASFCRGFDAAPAISVIGSLGWVGRLLRWQAEAVLTGERALPLANDRALWRRAAVEAGPSLRWSSSTALFELQSGLALALLTANGMDFARSFTTVAADVGLGAGARLALPLRPLSPGLRLGLTAWPIPHTLLVSGNSARQLIPQVEAVLALEVSFNAP